MPVSPPPGGAHEGLQHLGPYGNIPNIVAELTGDNVPKDFSDDHSYPDPPNPCPLGKTGRNSSSKQIIFSCLQKQQGVIIGSNAVSVSFFFQNCNFKIMNK